jgi:hypothetical protein
VQTTSNRVAWAMSIREAVSHVPFARMITRFVCYSVDSEYVFWYHVAVIQVVLMPTFVAFNYTHPTYYQNPS